MCTRQATTPPAPLVASGDADVKVGAGTKPPTNPDDGDDMAFRTPAGWTQPHVGKNGLYPHEMQGKIIRLHHVTVVPYHQHKESWSCVVVESIHSSYPVGGHDIVVGNRELADGEIQSVERPQA